MVRVNENICVKRIAEVKKIIVNQRRVEERGGGRWSEGKTNLIRR